LEPRYGNDAFDGSGVEWASAGDHPRGRPHAPRLGKEERKRWRARWWWLRRIGLGLRLLSARS